MLRMDPDSIIHSIQSGRLFSAITPDNAFSLTIERYVPFVCTAIHNGGNFIRQFLPELALTREERWLEEDPWTGHFIDSLPIRLIVYDSRYLYDLNRSPEECLYSEAWGHQVWKRPLTKEERSMFMERYDRFYRVLDVLTEYLTERFGKIVLYDIHSFNHQRMGQPEDLPLFNVGTEQIGSLSHEPAIESWLKELSGIGASHLENRVARNEVFFGRGHLLRHVMKEHPGSLVLATEIKKIYCDENTGDEFPEYIDIIRQGLKKAILNHAAYFANRETSLTVKQKYRLLSSGPEKALKTLDRGLFKLVKNFEMLYFVNPVNMERCKKQFFSSRQRQTPNFRYRPLPRKAHDLLQELRELPVDELKDVTLYQLYKDIVEDHIVATDMLISRGSRDFLYNSLRYYGEPEKEDMENARFILHCAGIDPPEDKIIGDRDALLYLREKLDFYDPSFHVDLSGQLAARAMVVTSRHTLFIRKGIFLGSGELEALAHHEIGIHVLTTLNAEKQPISCLRYGLPGHTETQEGLALLAEYLSGYLTLDRLRDLARRTLMVYGMLRGENFRDLVESGIEEMGLSPSDAFYLSARVFRGGGFTKDYLYLRGFIRVLRYIHDGGNPVNLMQGKVSLEYLETLRELTSRKFLVPPQHVPEVIENREPENRELQYILRSLKGHTVKEDDHWMDAGRSPKRSPAIT